MGGSGEVKMRLALALLLICTGALGKLDNSGEFFGARNTNKKIYQGLLNGTATFQLSEYVGSDALGNLLGYQPGGLDTTFRNGIPNPTNMMLWSLAFEKFSHDIGKVCHGNSDDSMAKQLREDVLADVLTLCSWPSDKARDEELWDRLWLYALAYDAPESEVVAWKTFFMTSYEVSTPEQLVSDAFFSIFMNPHYLLRK